MRPAVEVDRMYGPAAPEHGWVPAPRYLLRRARVLAVTADLPPGELLEVGCGAGMLLQEFARRGFRCTALESSAAASILAETLALAAGLAIRFRAAPEPRWRGLFDTVFAFDVLEHVADDRGALAEWVGWLRPAGRLVLSVPAHASRWSAGDEWAGHYRRYERADLERLAGEAGLEIERLECYGFPLANLTERVGARGYAARLRREARPGGPDRRRNTDRSGIERGPHVRLFPLMKSLPGRLALAACFGAQRLFLATDLGSGYLLRARRR
jgi:SAM-dependent methyltransferase